MQLANVGSIDRIFRLILGAALIAAPFVFGLAPIAPLAIGGFAAGAILIVTAIVRICPIYLATGLRTLKRS